MNKVNKQRVLVPQPRNIVISDQQVTPKKSLPRQAQSSIRGSSQNVQLSTGRAMPSARGQPDPSRQTTPYAAAGNAAKPRKLQHIASSNRRNVISNFNSSSSGVINPYVPGEPATGEASLDKDRFKNRYVIKTDNQYLYFPQPKDKSPAAGNQQIATGSVNIQIQVIDQNANKSKTTFRPTTTSRRRQIAAHQPPARVPNYYGAGECEESYLDAYGRHKNSVLTAGLKDSLDSHSRRQLQNLGSKNTSFKGDYESISYPAGHDLEGMHALTVRHARQIKTIEGRGAEPLFAAEDDPALLVVPVAEEVDISF